MYIIYIYILHPILIFQMAATPGENRNPVQHQAAAGAERVREKPTVARFATSTLRSTKVAMVAATNLSHENRKLRDLARDQTPGIQNSWMVDMDVHTLFIVSKILIRTICKRCFQS